MASDDRTGVPVADADDRHHRHRLFFPVAVAAIGLADLYTQVPLRLGQGLGGAAIALSSQDSGAGETANRDEAVTQALVIGALIGLPGDRGARRRPWT